MDFSIIYRIGAKKFWWMDIVFYFAISLLIATVFCYLIFLAKIAMQKKEIKEQEIALESVGTDQQKEYEKDVLLYQKKIADFIELFRNHEFASKVFGFIEQQTKPNIWFKSFDMNREGGAVKLPGEADNMEAFSRQVAAFETNEYVKKLNVLSSSAGDLARVSFNLDITLDPKIFAPLSETLDRLPSPAETITPSNGEVFP